MLTDLDLKAWLVEYPQKYAIGSEVYHKDIGWTVITGCECLHVEDGLFVWYYSLWDAINEFEESELQVSQILGYGKASKEVLEQNPDEEGDIIKIVLFAPRQTLGKWSLVKRLTNNYGSVRKCLELKRFDTRQEAIDFASDAGVLADGSQT